MSKPPPRWSSSQSFLFSRFSFLPSFPQSLLAQYHEARSDRASGVEWHANEAREEGGGGENNCLGGIMRWWLHISSIFFWWWGGGRRTDIAIRREKTCSCVPRIVWNVYLESIRMYVALTRGSMTHETHESRLVAPVQARVSFARSTQ